jgi:hypothetical protein
MRIDRDPMSPPTVVERRVPLTGRLIFGAIVLTLGLLWTAENLGLVDAESVLRWWPALLVAYGMVRLSGVDGSRRWVSGTLFTFLGLWMLAREAGLVNFSLWRLWPVFMIVMGASLVWRSLRRVPDAQGAVHDAWPRPFALMGGLTRSVESQDLVGIEVSAVMGGVELDLRGARARGPEVIVEAFAWWGGIELIVPEHWSVRSEVTPVMGAVEDVSRTSGEGAGTTLVVRGVVIMGGMEIRNDKRDDRFRSVRVGVNRRSRRKEVRVDAHGVTITREDDPEA